ncbi:MAG: gliding motility-associated C-terminal domain-containing protein [Ferruginibacter sp.]
MNIKPVCFILLIFISSRSGAQLCQGSLGDPIVNITFGSGGNPGPSLVAAATGYQYVSNDCPNDGYYTVRNNSTACFDNSWFNIPADHTGNGSGYFMLVNASIQPSDFYVDTVRGLCGNTTYEFAAWIVNVIRPESCNGSSNQPNLTFNIEKTDGTLLQTYNSGNIPPLAAPAWKQYGSFFTTPMGISNVVLRIRNNAAGGCGNDLALDDITFRPCGPLLIPSIAGQPTTTFSLCEGTSGSFNFLCTVSGGFTNPTYQWQESTNGSPWTDITGQNTTSLIRNFAANNPIGNYAFRLAVAESGNFGSPQCRIASAPLTVKVVANPVTTALSNSPVCTGSSLILTATGGSVYHWTGPDAFTGNGSPVSINNIQLSQQGKYYVLVENTDGCQHLDSTMVAVDPSPVAATSFSDTKICPGDSVIFSASGGITYEWQPAAGLSSATIASPHASPLNDVTYNVIVSNSFNCTDTTHINVNVIEPPYADAGPDKAMLENETVTIAATATGDNISYSWLASPYINNTLLLQPIASPPVDTKFILKVVSLDGCGSDTDTMEVFVYKQVFIPNAFSPNDDGVNDTWYIPALSAFKEFELYVYNRYGEMVFHTKNENRRWDGTFKKKKLPVGTYAYLVDFKRYMTPMKGTVMILR